ncbi:flagellar biosynthetic protein FliO [Sphingomonas sp. dw_22]|uniref:flagellar biosynthetic protein FliO n=1 Tax=Sphingomonas sp. dw_22 TaxID=2721175 RepID=UPI001BD29CE0|nr:flagellar biosynthetic protein FliO [Sphingomonas sp. dw_22]
MDILSMLRTIGALGLVLGMLGSALWIVRRYDVKLPGRISSTGRKRVELVERLAVDGKRSVALIRRDGCEHLILIGPEGHATIETGIVAPLPPEPAMAQPVAALPTIEADLAVLKSTVSSSFGKLVDKAGIAREGVTRLVDKSNVGKLIEMQRLRARKPVTAQPSKRTRRPRDTARWNRAAVREALDA